MIELLAGVVVTCMAITAILLIVWPRRTKHLSEIREHLKYYDLYKGGKP